MGWVVHMAFVVQPFEEDTFVGHHTLVEVVEAYIVEGTLAVVVALVVVDKVADHMALVVVVVVW